MATKKKAAPPATKTKATNKKAAPNKADAKKAPAAKKATAKKATAKAAAKPAAKPAKAAPAKATPAKAVKQKIARAPQAKPAAAPQAKPARAPQAKPARAPQAKPAPAPQAKPATEAKVKPAKAPKAAKTSSAKSAPVKAMDKSVKASAPKAVKASAPKAAKASAPKAAKGEAPAAAGSSQEGKKAPNFTLADQSGNTVSSAELAGKPYVLYFYPKDNTPGCTMEACDFRDSFGRFEKTDVRVFGVSPDSSKSHAGFASKFELPFTLLADTDKSLVNAYGVWVKKLNYGREYMGVERSTFLVAGDGTIAKAWRNVRVKGHVDQVLEAAQNL